MCPLPPIPQFLLPCYLSLFQNKDGRNKGSYSLVLGKVFGIRPELYSSSNCHCGALLSLLTGQFSVAGKQNGSCAPALAAVQILLARLSVAALRYHARPYRLPCKFAHMHTRTQYTLYTCTHFCISLRLCKAQK